MDGDRVRKARLQEAALRRVDAAEKRAEKKVHEAEALRDEAADIRRQAVMDAKLTGVSAQDLADRLGVSVQRIYQLLADAAPD